MTPPTPRTCLPINMVFFRLVWRALGWTDAREEFVTNPVVARAKRAGKKNQIGGAVRGVGGTMEI